MITVNLNDLLKEKTAAFVAKSNRPLPFSCVIFDDEPQEVENRFGYGSCVLEPDAIAVYDMIMGAELMGNYELMDLGKDWFLKYFPKEYMILLD